MVGNICKFNDRDWRLASPGKGLGVSGGTEWDTPLADYFDQSDIASISTASTPTSTPISNRSRILCIYQISLIPGHARRAPISPPCSTGAREGRPATIRPTWADKKVKRKAVPTFKPSEVSSRPSLLHGLPAFGNWRSFYQNRPAAFSVIELSPRTVSLSFSVPPRIASHRSESSSSSSSWSDPPITPISEQEAFIDQLEFGLRRLGQGMTEQRVEVGLSTLGYGSKHKRGLSRFFGR